MLLEIRLSRLVGTLFFFTSETTFFFADNAYAGTNFSSDQAVATALHSFDIPLSILESVTKIETGRFRNGELEPWPWTVNMDGQGYWLYSKHEVIKNANANVRLAVTNVDIGFFQLNYRWHGGAFTSITEVFNLVENAVYAENFLGKLYAEKENGRIWLAFATSEQESILIAVNTDFRKIMKIYQSEALWRRLVLNRWYEKSGSHYCGELNQNYDLGC